MSPHTLLGAALRLSKAPAGDAAPEFRDVAAGDGGSGPAREEFAGAAICIAPPTHPARPMGGGGAGPAGCDPPRCPRRAPLHAAPRALPGSRACPARRAPCPVPVERPARPRNTARPARGAPQPAHGALPHARRDTGERRSPRSRPPTRGSGSRRSAGAGVTAGRELPAGPGAAQRGCSRPRCRARARGAGAGGVAAVGAGAGAAGRWRVGGELVASCRACPGISRSPAAFPRVGGGGRRRGPSGGRGRAGRAWVCENRWQVGQSSPQLLLGLRAPAPSRCTCVRVFVIVVRVGGKNRRCR